MENRINSKLVIISSEKAIPAMAAARGVRSLFLVTEISVAMVFPPG
jgi:hypothetical protein